MLEQTNYSQLYTPWVIMSNGIDYDSKKEDVNAYVQEGVVEPASLLDDTAGSTSHHAVKRVMTTRQIQFYAIGGTIGTAVFVSVSNPKLVTEERLC